MKNDKIINKNIKGVKSESNGPGRVGAQSGLGPGPGLGPYGPIGPLWWARFCLKIMNFDNKS